MSCGACGVLHPEGFCGGDALTNSDRLRSYPKSDQELNNEAARKYRERTPDPHESWEDYWKQVAHKRK